MPGPRAEVLADESGATRLPVVLDPIVVPPPCRRYQTSLHPNLNHLCMDRPTWEKQGCCPSATGSGRTA